MAIYPDTVFIFDKLAKVLGLSLSCYFWKRNFKEYQRQHSDIQKNILIKTAKEFEVYLKGEEK